jgi:hypothetical protein
MKRESGCQNADAGALGTRSSQWTLEAGSLGVLEAFVRMADTHVPGCSLEVEEIVEPPVKDVVTDHPLLDWRTHEFASAEALFSVEVRMPDVLPDRSSASIPPIERFSKGPQAAD